jgi:hypothetical protein
MRTDWPSVFLLTLGIVALAIYPRSAPSQPAASQVSPINPPVADCNANKFTGPESGFLSAAPPCAPNFASPFVDSKGVSHTFDIDGLQHNFDFYSWETFVALNWPNGGGTAIGKGPRPGGDAQSAWEDVKNFRQLPDVMLEDGAKPSWGSRIVPAECQSMDGPGKMVIHVIEEAFDQPFKSGPLIDQNGNYALFDILINKPMFDYIVENGLYSRRGQEQFVAGRTAAPQTWFRPVLARPRARLRASSISQRAANRQKTVRERWARSCSRFPGRFSGMVTTRRSFIPSTASFSRGAAKELRVAASRELSA